MSGGITYEAAKAALTDSDFNRLACAYFHMGADGKINYETAAQDYGSTTASMRVMVNAALRKIRAGTPNGSGDSSGATNAGSEAGATPKKKRAPKKATDGEAKGGKGRKRAVGADESLGDDQEEVKREEVKAGPKKRKVAAKNGKVDAKMEKMDAEVKVEAESEVPIKDEPNFDELINYEYVVEDMV